MALSYRDGDGRAKVGTDPSESLMELAWRLEELAEDPQSEPRNVVSLLQETADRLRAARSFLRDEGQEELGSWLQEEHQVLVDQATRLDRMADRADSQPESPVLRAHQQAYSGLAYRLAYALRKIYAGELRRLPRVGDPPGPGAATAAIPERYHRFDETAPDALLATFSDWLKLPHRIKAAMARGDDNAATRLWIEALQAGAVVQLAAMENQLLPDPVWTRDFGMGIQIEDGVAVQGVVDLVDPDLSAEARERAKKVAESGSHVSAIDCVIRLQAIYQAKQYVAVGSTGNGGSPIQHYDFEHEDHGDIRGAAQWAWKCVQDLAEYFCKQLCGTCQHTLEGGAGTDNDHGAETNQLASGEWLQKQRELHQAFRYLPPVAGEIGCPSCAVVRAFTVFPIIAKHSPSQPIAEVVNYFGMDGLDDFAPDDPEHNQPESFPCCRFTNCVEGISAGGWERAREEVLLLLNVDALPPMPPPIRVAIRAAFVPGQQVAKQLKAMADGREDEWTEASGVGDDEVRKSGGAIGPDGQDSAALPSPDDAASVAASLRPEDDPGLTPFARMIAKVLRAAQPDWRKIIGKNFSSAEQRALFWLVENGLVEARVEARARFFGRKESVQLWCVVTGRFRGDLLAATLGAVDGALRGETIAEKCVFRFDYREARLTADGIHAKERLNTPGYRALLAATEARWRQKVPKASPCQLQIETEKVDQDEVYEGQVSSLRDFSTRSGSDIPDLPTWSFEEGNQVASVEEPPPDRYDELAKEEMQWLKTSMTEVSQAASRGDLPTVLGVLEADLRRWAASCYRHLPELYDTYQMEGPREFGVGLMPMWLVRPVVGAKEAFEMLEISRGTECAAVLSRRLGALSDAREEFAEQATSFRGFPESEEFNDFWSEVDHQGKRTQELAGSVADYVRLFRAQIAGGGDGSGSFRPTDSDDKSVTNAVESVPDAWALAYQSYQWVCSEHPEVIPDSESRKRYTVEMYNKMKEEAPTYGEGAPPSFESWKTYIRKFEHASNGPKNTPRAGRQHGSSIVRQDEI